MKSYISENDINHAKVEEAVSSFLKDRGFAVARQIRVRTWRPDFVAVKGDTVLIAEAVGARGDIRRALLHVALYATDATSAYLAVPATRVDAKLKTAAKALEVGLMAVGGRTEVIVEPSIGPPRPAFLRRMKKALKIRDNRTHAVERRRPTPLHRVLRNRGVLDALLSDRERRFTIRELSIEARTPYSTTRRAVLDLVSLGVIVSERVGPSEYLSLNTGSPLLDELAKLRSVNLSPHRAAAGEFSRIVAVIPEVRKVVLFGSVAEGEETTASDIDIAVFVSARRREPVQRILDAASEVQERTRLNITPFMTTTKARLRGQLARAIQAGEVLFERH